jgi:Phage integrase, N-terminal SAM-like domain
MLETTTAPALITERMTIADVGDRRIKHLARSGRKPDTTLANYEAEIRIHFGPYFNDTPVDDISADDVEDFIDACLDAEDRAERGLAPLSVKMVRNLYVHLNGIFEFAVSKGWCHANPYRAVDKPASPDDDDQEIRFLDHEELDALLVAAVTPRAGTHPRPSPAPPRRGHCATSSTWNGSRSVNGWAALPLRRSTSTAHGPKPCWKTTSHTSTTRSTSPLR